MNTSSKATPAVEKRWCGCPHKRVGCGLAILAVIAAAVIIAVVLTRPPDDIETVEQDEEDIPVNVGELTILRTASLSGTAATGTLSLLRVTEDSSSLLALNDLVVADADCSAFEVRLDDGLEVIPLTADVVSGTAADFTEPLDTDFDPDMFDQASLWCSSDESQLGEAVDLDTPTTLEGVDTVVVFQQATLVTTTSYTTEGLVQFVGSGSIVDDALTYTYWLRFEEIEVSPGPDVYLYLTTDADEPDDVDAEGSLRVELDDSERGTFSFTGTFTQTTLPEGFVSPDVYVGAVVWCDDFSVFFGSGLFEDV
eukprot:g5989.t1